jgi:hypothetical protein
MWKNLHSLFGKGVGEIWTNKLEKSWKYERSD